MPFITTAVVAGLTAAISAAGTAAAAVGGAAAATGTAVAAGAGAVAGAVGTAASAIGTAAMALTPLEAAMIDLGLASTAMAAYAPYAMGKQQEANAERNAQIMRNQALEEERAATYGATRLAERGRRLRGTQRVLLSKAGLLGAGTPLLLIKQTAEELQADISMIMRGGRVRGGFLRQKAGITLAGGRDLGRAGIIGAGTALLSGASGTLLRYRQMRT